MYISEIKIHGFKSFAKKEIIKLGPGITAVVGPNDPDAMPSGVLAGPA